MKQVQPIMRPQDILILLKIAGLADQSWYHHTLADCLLMSQSEITQSLNRSRYAGLLDASRKKVFTNALFEFLQYGIRYVFPQQPGPVVRGIPTAHSAKPLNLMINSSEQFVWPWAKGSSRGQAIVPLYKTVPDAVKLDEELYELLALVDAIRVGKARERQLAIKELKQRIIL